MVISILKVSMFDYKDATIKIYLKWSKTATSFFFFFSL